MMPNQFIEVTALIDHRPACIRVDAIEAVWENDEADIDGAIKPACRTIVFGGRSLDVVDEYEDIKAKIWNAEL